MGNSDENCVLGKSMLFRVFLLLVLEIVIEVQNQKNVCVCVRALACVHAYECVRVCLKMKLKMKHFNKVMFSIFKSFLNWHSSTSINV